MEFQRTDVQGRGILTALVPIAVLWFLWLAGGWIAAGDFRQFMLVGVGFAVICVAGMIINGWRTGVYIFLVWLLFEDLIRKYMGNNMNIYFAKDVLVGITYLVFLRTPRENTKFLPASLKFSLGLFFLLGVAQAFNPDSPSLVYGVLGLKLYFYYVPLIFVGYALVRTELDLQRFLFVSMGAAGVIALLGIIQSIVGLDFLNPRGGEDINELGHLTRFTPSGVAVPRPPSVFVSDGRFAQYLVLTFILGLGAAGYLLLRTKRGRKLVFPAVGLVGVAAIMSGGRGSFAYVAASALIIPAGLLWGAPATGPEAYRIFKAIRRAFMVVALGTSIALVLFPQEIGARLTFYRETIVPDSPDSVAFNRAWDYPVQNLLSALSDRDWMVGHGIGRASLGVQYVGHLLGQSAPPVGVESGYGVLIAETGILGPVLWLGWTLMFILAAIKVVFRTKGRATFPIALSIFWFSLLLLFPFTWGSIVAYQNFILNAYFWLLAGILFRLPTLEPYNFAYMQVNSAPSR